MEKSPVSCATVLTYFLDLCFRFNYQLALAHFLTRKEFLDVHSFPSFQGFSTVSVSKYLNLQLSWWVYHPESLRANNKYCITIHWTFFVSVFRNSSVIFQDNKLVYCRRHEKKSKHEVFYAWIIEKHLVIDIEWFENGSNEIAYSLEREVKVHAT